MIWWQKPKEKNYLKEQQAILREIQILEILIEDRWYSKKRLECHKKRVEKKIERLKQNDRWFNGSTA